MDEQVARSADDLLTSDALAEALGVSETTIRDWTARRLIAAVPNARRRLYDVAQVRAALAELGWTGGTLYTPGSRKARAVTQRAAGLRACYICKRSLPFDQFLTIRQMDKRGRGYEYNGPSFECSECRMAQRREWRRRKAEQAGREFVPRGNRAAYEEQCRIARDQRKVDWQERCRAMLAEHEARRQEIRERTEHRCTKCLRMKQRGEFYPSSIATGRESQMICRACYADIMSARFKRDRESLSDGYIKRQLTKYSGLRRGDIPSVLIEAKRAQLMLERALPPTCELYANWLKLVLVGGPLDAEKLSRLAQEARFDMGDITLRRQRRKAGATYDETTNTWRMHGNA